jgi:hypothetical protein
MAEGRPLRVLHLLGVDDSRTVRVARLSPVLDRRRYEYVGNVELRGVLAGSGFEVSTLLCGPIPSDRPRLDDFDVAVNAVCDADTNGGALDAVAELVASAGLPVVNNPISVKRTTRDRVAAVLDGTPDLVVPRTARIKPRYTTEVEDLAAAAGIHFPFLFREAGTHGGERLIVLRSGADLRQLEQFAFDGRPFYVTEFVDARSTDGLYRKHRTLVVGGQAFPKHLIASPEWNVHADSRPYMAARPALADEEERFVEGDVPTGFHAAFAAMHARLQLDYFGADHAIDSAGRVVIFEVNACFRPLAGSASESAVPSHEASTQRIRRALADVVRRRAAERAVHPVEDA